MKSFSDFFLRLTLVLFEVFWKRFRRFQEFEIGKRFSKFEFYLSVKNQALTPQKFQCKILIPRLPSAIDNKGDLKTRSPTITLINDDCWRS